MAEWVFDKNGTATIILDNDCLRNNSGSVVAWIAGQNIYSMNGNHIGWFNGGVFYDSNNNVLGFIMDSTGSMPYQPGTSGTPGMPGFSGRPGRSGFGGAPGRPGYGGWSSCDLKTYFSR
ncbi:MAG: collagen-like protein [Geobacteraceae bacterium]